MGLNLLAKISLDGSGFARGLDNVAHHLKGMVAGAFGVYAIEQAIHRTIEAAEEFVNGAKRMGSTVEEFQILKQAAKDSGAEVGALTGAFEKLNVARGKIAAGDKSTAKLLASFAQLGISPEQLKSQRASALVMGPISQAVRAGNQEELAKPLRDILGKGFGELMPLLKTDFDELGDKMQRFGTIMNTETAIKLKAVGDQLSILSNIIAVKLGPVLISLTEFLVVALGHLKSVYSGLKAGGTNWSEIFDALVDPYKMTKLLLKLSKKDSADAGRIAVEGQENQNAAEFNKMKEDLAKAAADLKKGGMPAFDIEGGTAKAKRMREGDSLIRVGNFLGATGNAINRIETQKVQLLTGINQNTGKTADALRNLTAGSIFNSGVMGAIFPP